MAEAKAYEEFLLQLALWFRWPLEVRPLEPGAPKEKNDHLLC